MRRVVVLVIVGLLGAAPAAAATPIKIIDTKAVEVRPSVADGWDVWTANTLAHPNALHGYVRPTGGAIEQIPIGGHTRTGNIITDGPHAGQVVVRTDATGNGDIRFYDLTTGDVSKPPAGVNTSKQEWDPSVSGDYLAFTRGFRTRTLWLYQFSSDTFVKITNDGPLRPRVNGDYVAYMGCTSTACKSVYRYRISTGKSIKIPAPASGRANYDPAVAADGTMFWVEGDVDQCGRNTKIKRWSAGAVSNVWLAGDGVEVGFMQVNTLGGMPTLAFARAICPYKNDVWGVYRIEI